MAIVTRRYLWTGANLSAIQNNGDPGSTLPPLGYTAHVDVTFDDAISDAVVVDTQMVLLGYVFETVAPVTPTLFDISNALRFIERVGDPTAELNNILLYAKDVAGITQLFIRASDGTIQQVTPVPGASTFTWGNDSVAAGADTRFLTPGRGPTALLTDVQMIPAPRAGVLQNLFVRHQSAVGNGNIVSYAVMLNGVATGLVTTLATGAIGQSFNTIPTVVVAQGDQISLRAVKALSIANGSINTQVSCMFM